MLFLYNTIQNRKKTFIVLFIFTFLCYTFFMIVYSTECDTRFTDYGILIPIRYNKAKMVYEKLCIGCMQNVEKAKWVYTPSNNPMNKALLLLCHSKRYVESLLGKDCEKEVVRTYELLNEDGSFNRYEPKTAQKPLSNLVHENLVGAQAGCEAAEIALKTGFSFFLGGGSHHAMVDYGSGFCLVNDVVLMARYVQKKALAKNIWIIDVDAHKGDGSAFITRDDDTIRTLSIHMKHGWPLDSNEYNENEVFNPSWTKSDIDIGIAKGEELQYVSKLREGLFWLEKNFGSCDLAIVVGGVDPYEKDELASTKDLSLTKEMLLERDLLVYNFFKTRNIPQTHVMAGGYGECSWEIYVNFLEHVLPEYISV